MSNPTHFSVKPEPRDIEISSLLRSRAAFHPVNVKHEVSDAAHVLNRGPPLPSYVMNNQASSSTQLGVSAHVPDSITAKLEEAEAMQAVEAIQPKFKVYASASEITYGPEMALKEGVQMVKTIKEGLQKLEIGSTLRKEVWNREISNLEDQATPKTLIAVCGATGAGKSSVLNAVLADNVVPTSGMRACTAVVTELSYHKKSTIEADISFLSEAEWRQELAVLLHDMVDEEGNIKRLTDLKSDAGIAWQKVHAVYPTMTPEALTRMDVDHILDYDPAIKMILGNTKKISARDSKTFAKEIGIYIDSKDQKSKKSKKDKKDQEKKKKGADTSIGKAPTDKTNSAALWPLIRQVNVRCRAKALSTGAVLVDLPGVADANAARNNIAKDYMKKCNCIWILAPITRAVDDKTAKDLLGEAFKIQLLNGNYDDHAITFIASKCDDISCSEAIPGLKLEGDPTLEDIEDRLQRYRSNVSDFKKRKNTAEKEIKEINNELKDIRERIKDHTKHLAALEMGEKYVSTLKKSTENQKKRKSAFSEKSSRKRKRSLSGSDEDSTDDSSEDLGSSDSSDGSDDFEEESDNDSDDSDNDKEEIEKSDFEMGSDDEASDSDDAMDEVTEESIKAMIKNDKDLIKTTRQRLNEVRARKKEVADSLSSAEKSAAKVQKEKNAFCSLKRSEFSRGVLKEDFRAGLKELDDAAAEERDPQNFNPYHNIRDYDAIDLPVFTCSSRDYVRLTGQVKGDGPSTCFSNIEDTGIPALQQWCHKLTVASRQRAARTFMTHIKAFAQSIQSYVEGHGEVTVADREKLREKWESHNLAGDINLDVWGQFGVDMGMDLYTLNPKVDPYGDNIGVTPRLCKAFAEIVDKCVSGLKQHFKDGLEAKCTTGAANAAEAALSTLDEFTGSMHWQTYRATLRRHGSWRRDLNLELTNPFTKSIAHSWSKVFESDLFGPFQDATLATIKSLIKDVEESAAPSLKDRAKTQGDICVEEACVALTKAIDLVKQTMNTEQKEVSRCMAPHVQGQLTDGYNEALEERGTGSVARQKAMFRAYLSECKGNMFDGGANIVLEKLNTVSDAIGETLDGTMGNLAQKIEVSLAVLWEGARDSPAQKMVRNGVIEVVKTVQEQVKMWGDADKAAQQLDRRLDAMEED